MENRCWRSRKKGDKGRSFESVLGPEGHLSHVTQLGQAGLRHQIADTAHPFFRGPLISIWSVIFDNSSVGLTIKSARIDADGRHTHMASSPFPPTHRPKPQRAPGTLQLIGQLSTRGASNCEPFGSHFAELAFRIIGHWASQARVLINQLRPKLWPFSAGKGFCQKLLIYSLGPLAAHEGGIFWPVSIKKASFDNIFPQK